MKGFAVTVLPDESWINPKIARAVGHDDDPWGILSIMRGTGWEPLIPVIPFEIFDQALRGYSTPLMQILGPPPKALLRRVPAPASVVGRLTDPNYVLGPDLLDDWDGGVLPGPDSFAIIYGVLSYWKEGVPVIVVLPE